MTVTYTGTRNRVINCDIIAMTSQPTSASTATNPISCLGTSTHTISKSFYSPTAPTGTAYLVIRAGALQSEFRTSVNPTVSITYDISENTAQKTTTSIPQWTDLFKTISQRNTGNTCVGHALTFKQTTSHTDVTKPLSTQNSACNAALILFDGSIKSGTPTASLTSSKALLFSYDIRHNSGNAFTCDLYIKQDSTSGTLIDSANTARFNSPGTKIAEDLECSRTGSYSVIIPNASTLGNAKYIHFTLHPGYDRPRSVGNQYAFVENVDLQVIATPIKKPTISLTNVSYLLTGTDSNGATQISNNPRVTVSITPGNNNDITPNLKDVQYRKTGTSTWIPHQTNAVGIGGSIVLLPDPGATYQFRVRLGTTTNNNIESPWSNIVTITTQHRPASPPLLYTISHSSDSFLIGKQPGVTQSPQSITQTIWQCHNSRDNISAGTQHTRSGNPLSLIHI